ncbi:hypothetical protein MN116_005023 [Schistosoma mekongi]|uniref:POU domain protein n=1 Tax=Schistosoma mekongi TaxID=38744 RepID=A0AAE2D511_SCHME|nr:hypothetical protein MN116_005023 [Schistosoma mekongi]
MHKMNLKSSLFYVNKLNCITFKQNEQNSLFQNKTLKFDDNESLGINDDIIPYPTLETNNYFSHIHPLNSVIQPSDTVQQNSYSYEINCCIGFDSSTSFNPISNNNLHGQSSNLSLLMNNYHHPSNMFSSMWDKQSFLSSVSRITLNSDYTVTQATDQPLNKLDNLAGFVEIFKRKRINLGITQAEVGRALGTLNLSGFGCLSQSTICRFESFALSHNNMLALKPVLEMWLKQMEEGLQLNQNIKRNLNRLNYTDYLVNSSYSPTNTLPVSVPLNSLKQSTRRQRRKRTSIMGKEKYILESFFHTISCRPSSEQMNQLAMQLNMQKCVIQVWFCNQRQKYKRLSKISSNSLGEEI